MDAEGFVAQLIPAITDAFHSTIKETLQETTALTNAMLIQLEAILAHLALAITGKQMSPPPAPFPTPSALFPIPPAPSPMPLTPPALSQSCDNSAERD